MQRHRQSVCNRLMVAALCVIATSATAQDFPRKSFEIVVPFVAGGTTDNIARLIGQRFTDVFGQTVVVSNRPGAGGTIGAGLVAKAAPDGHTLLVTTIGFVINAALQKLPFDPMRDFAPVVELASLPMMLVVHPAVPARDVAELVALAKAKPGGLDYASAGIGTSPHLAAEMFKSMAGVDLVHVPFKGNAEANNALLGGHVRTYFALMPAVIQHVRAGNLRALAVTIPHRLPELPELPTVAEAGFPGYEISSWQGVFVPAGTPKEVVDRINGEIVRLIGSPDVRARMDAEGAIPIGGTPAAFAERVRNEIVKWRDVMRVAGIATAN